MNINKIYKASSLEECFPYLEQGYKILAGGTDVVVQLSEGHMEQVDLLDVSDVKELKVFRVGDEIEIGAGLTFTEVIEKEREFPEHIKGFIESLKLVGSPQIRNAGTVGGNICNGSPAADSIPPLICLSARLIIVSKTKQREINIDDFFLGKGKVALEQGEIVKSIVFSVPTEGKLNFYKYSLRNALSITLGSIACLIDVEKDVVKDIKIASGGFSAYCQREFEMEELFKGVSLENTYDLIKDADKIVQNRIQMFDDEFKTMKNVTLSGALMHVIRG